MSKQLGRLFASVILVAALLGVLPVVPAPPAAAGPDDAFTVTKTNDVGGEALIGENVTFTITASGDQVSGNDLYNLSFRDVLPAGTGYVSADPAPSEILVDVPSVGETTLIWTNVSDLPAGAESSISVTVDTDPDGVATTLPVGSSFTNTAEGAASLDPFLIPDHDPGTGAFTTDVDGSGTATNTVDMIAFRVVKDADGELLRGVHDTATSGQLYTVTVQNNPNYGVDAITLVDTLEPALEFLGCDGYYAADNTTVGEEFPGSGPIVTGTGCGATALTTPESVDTGAGGETIVTWDLGNLAAGASVAVSYQAGFPLFENRPFAGAAPTPASLGQGRNLDNNTGPSTGETDATVNPDPELLSGGEQDTDNTASATGTYTPTAATATDDDVFTTQPEDLHIAKSMSGSLVQGSTVNATLTITTSEYRDVADLVVRDLLPSSLCFIGTYTADLTPGGSDWATNDCPGAGTVSSTVNGSPVAAASVRELPDGGPYGTGRLEVVWDASVLPDVAADGTLTITYAMVVREDYRGSYARLTAEPVLAGDLVRNRVEVSGADGAITGLAADPADPDGGRDGDTASATIQNGLPTIDKRVSERTGPLAAGAGATGATCGASYGSITWAQGDPSAVTGFGPDDIVCFELGASFAVNVDFEGVRIQDLLPPEYSYVAGSATRITSIDTLPATSVTEGTNVVTFDVEGTGLVNASGNEFRWVIAAQLADPDSAAPADVSANLQKLVHNDNGGLVYQLRDQAAVEWAEPVVQIAKGVADLNTVATAGPDVDGSLTGGSTATEVAAGDVVGFRVDVWNEGSADATATEVQDVLPDGITCAEVSAISNSGTCSSDVITWTGLTIPASIGGGDTTPDDETTAPLTLTYDVTIPAGVFPGESLVNTAGVASYAVVTNSGTTTTYYPAGNIDPTNAALENAPAADDPAYLQVEGVVVDKTQRSGIDEAGNSANDPLGTADDAATIGEIVQYEVTVTIPDGVTLYDAQIRDPLPSGLSYFTGNGYFAGSVSNLQPTVTGTAGLTAGSVTTSGSNVLYDLPDPWVNAAGSGDDTVTITFYAQVDDVVANVADPTPTEFRNRGRLRFDDDGGVQQSDVLSNRVDLQVVEPNPTITKDHTSPAGSSALPGDTITYRIAVLNDDSTVGNVSVAHDIEVVDTVPVGLTPIGVGAVPVSSDGDLVPSTGVSPVGSFTGTWSETSRTITWTPTDWASLEAVDPGAGTTFTYDVEVDDPAVASSALTNSAALTASSLDQDLSPTEDPNEGDARTYTATDNDTITVPVATIDKDIEPFDAGDPANDVSSLTIGEPVDYEVTIAVPDGTVAYDATIFDELPAELEFDSFGSVSVASQCEVFDAALGATTGSSLVPGDIERFSSAGGVTGRLAWFVGDIVADGACEITVAYTAHVTDAAVAGDTVTNDALIVFNGDDEIASQSPVGLPAGYDDPTSVQWDIDEGPATQTFTVTEPALEIDKDVTDTADAALAGPACDTTPGNDTAASNDVDGTATNGCDVQAGDQVRYTLTITSTGTSAAHDVTVVDTVPVGLTPLSAPGGSAVTVDGQTVTGDSGSTGTWDATARTITWTLAGPYAPAATATVDYDADLDASDELDRGQDLANLADVEQFFGVAEADRDQIVLDNAGNDDLIEYGNGATATRGSVDTDVATIEVHFPDLSVTKDETVGEDPTDVRFDESYSWTIAITNTDAVADAFGVDAVDVLPAGWTYDAGSAVVTTPHSGGAIAVEPTCTADTGVCGATATANVETLTWTDLVSGAAEPLGPGETITIVFTATPQSAALAPDGTTGAANTGYDGGAGPAHTNDVAVTAEDATGSASCCDPDGAGPGLPESYTATDDDDAWIARADIEVDKAITPVEVDGDPVNGPYWFGSTVDYTITVDNAGPDDASTVTVADVLDPTELEFVSVVSVDRGSFDDGTNVWTVGAVADGDSLELVLRVRLIGIGSVTNVAQAETVDQYDADSTPGNDVGTEDDHDTVTIEVVPTSLGDTVWLDLDGDGVIDAGEPGIPDVEIDVTWTDPDGTPRSYTTTTGADGSWGVPPSAGLPSNTDITVTVDTASSPNLDTLSPSFDRDGTGTPHVSVDQVTTADSALPDGRLADLDFDFGYVGDQSLGNRIWWDVDVSADATDGIGEPGIRLLDVTATWFGWDGIQGTADDLVLVDTTDATGTYLFTGIPAGDYEVVVDRADLPAGLEIATFDLDGIATLDTIVATVDPGEQRRALDFSYTGDGSIGDIVWFDHDGDGVIDTGEPGLGGVLVTLQWAGADGVFGDDPGLPGDQSLDDVTLTTTTAADGSYLFENLPDGDYVITVDDTTLPGGLTPTFDDDGVGTPHSSAVTLIGLADDDLDQDFGYRGLGTVGDTVFFDIDGTEADGTPDTGDAGIPDVDVTVVWAGADGVLGDDPGTVGVDESLDDFTITVTTDAGGDYSVGNLPHGDVSITVDDTDLPTGLDTATYDADGVGTPHTSVTTLDAVSPDDLGQDFAYTGATAGVIGDTVWFDLDGDGTQDTGEVGFSGVTVSLTWYGPDGIEGTTDDVVQTTTTDADGNYLFDNLPDGTFDVTVDDSTLPAGLAPTHDDDGTATAHTSTVTIDDGNPSSLDQDFGYRGAGSVGDTLWYDVDASGTATADPDEPPLVGVTVEVTWTNPQGDDLTVTTTTDPDGEYLVEHLPYGTVTVTVVDTTLPGGMVPSYDDDGAGTAHTAVTTLDAVSPDDLDLDFSYTGAGSIGDTLWYDVDADGALDPAGSGVFDGEDQAIAGVDVTVTWGGPDGVIGDDPLTLGVDESLDDVVHTATTDADGEWLVPNLPHGPYEIVVDDATLPSGITSPTLDDDGIVTPHVSGTSLGTLAPDDLDQDFSYTGLGTIGDTVFFDLDGDGEVDPDEVGLAGITVTVTFTGPDGSTVTLTDVTDADGEYRFDNLPYDVPITVTVTDTDLPSGFEPASDDDGIGTPHTSVTTLTAAEPADLDQDFGYRGTGSIGDTVFLDRDGTELDGVPDVVGDVGIPGVPVTLTWTNPTGGADLTTSVTTDADGRYVFPGLPHGDYTITIDPDDLPAGTTPTYDADGIGTALASSTTLDAVDPDDLDQDFAVTGTGSIGDTLWRDEDGDGVLDGDEDPIAGVTVRITVVDPVTGLTWTETTVTDVDGGYSFEGLPAGDHTVEVVTSTLPDGFVPTVDLDGIATPHTTAVTLGAGEDRTDVDFGYRPEADLAVVKSSDGAFVIGADNVWTIAVENLGPATAVAPVVVTDTLPAHTTFVRADGPWDCTAAGADVTCTLVDTAGEPADLASGDRVELDLVVAVAPEAAGTATNTAVVSTPTVDPDPSNDEDDDQVDVPLSVLDIDKTADGDFDELRSGTYVITVTNRGPSATRGDVVITDELPAGLRAIGTSSDRTTGTCSIVDDVVTCVDTGVLDVGDQWTIELDVTVTAAAGTVIENVAVVTGGNDVGDESISATTLSEIGDRLDDPTDDLATALGITGDTRDSDAAIVTVSTPGILAFTGAETSTLVTGAAILLLLGGALVFATRRRSTNP